MDVETAENELPELAFRAFVRTYGLVRGKMEPHFAKFGISGAQWGLLRALQRAEAEGLAALRLTDLGRRLLVKPPSVSAVVARLQRAGLVRRNVAAADQRARLVTLTPAGRQLLARVLERHPERIRSIMAALSQPEQRQLYDLSRRLADHLETDALGQSQDHSPYVEDAHDEDRTNG